MLAVDEHIGIDAVSVEAVGGAVYTPAEYREMFLGAIDIQKSTIDHAERMIKHYEDALSELAKEAADVA